MSVIAYIGIGSNLGKKVANCLNAIEMLGKIPGCELMEHSNLYRSSPVGVEGQDWYVNGVASIGSSISAEALLSDLLSIEKVNTFAFAFLESPGIAYNEDDDDKDGMLNERMDDGIDNDGDWEPFADIGLDRMGSDHLEYKGPDLDGTEGNGVWDTEDTNLNGALDNGEDKNKNDKLEQ